MSGFRKKRGLNSGHGFLSSPDPISLVSILQSLSLGRKPRIITPGRWLWYGEKSTDLVLLCDLEQVARASLSPSFSLCKKGICVSIIHGGSENRVKEEM